jgi:hypothetical protein
VDRASCTDRRVRAWEIGYVGATCFGRLAGGTCPHLVRIRQGRSKRRPYEALVPCVGTEGEGSRLPEWVGGIVEHFRDGA